MSSAVSVGSELRSRNLPSRCCSARTTARSTLSRPLGVWRRKRLSPRLACSRACELGTLGRAEPVGILDGVLELGDQLVTDGTVALGLVGVAADHEAVAHGAVVDAHLLDLEVAGDGPVATLARQRRLGFP